MLRRLRRIGDPVGDPVRRQMRGPGRDGHGEAGAPIDLAGDRDGAAMHADQFAHEREADARPLVRAAAAALDAQEALEDARQGLGGDADAGIGHGQAHRARNRFQPDDDAAPEGELEGVRQEVEDDLLPHVPVHEDRLGQRETLDPQGQASPLDGRAERAGEVFRQGREIDLREGGLRAAGLDPGEVEERVDETQQAQRVAVRHVELCPDARFEPIVGQHLFQRSEHQGQRRAELVADVGEELRLGAVEFGQGLGPAPLRLVGAGVAQGRGDLPRHEMEEVAVALVERAARTRAEDEDPERRRAGLAGERENQRAVGRVRPETGRQGEAVRQPVDGDGLSREGAVERPARGARQRGGMVRADAGRRRQTRTAVRLAQEKEREGHVEPVVRERASDVGAGRVDAPGLSGLGREVAQQTQPTLADHLRGDLAADGQHADDMAVVILGRRVGDAEISLLPVAGPLHQQWQRRGPVRLAGPHDAGDHRPERVPARRQRDADVAAERLRMAGADQLGVGIVVDLGEGRSPGQDHRVLRRQERAHGRAQALRPARDRPERRARPVERPRQGPDLTCAGEQSLGRGIRGVHGWTMAAVPFRRNSQHVAPRGATQEPGALRIGSDACPGVAVVGSGSNPQALKPSGKRAYRTRSTMGTESRRAGGSARSRSPAPNISRKPRCGMWA